MKCLVAMLAVVALATPLQAQMNPYTLKNDMISRTIVVSDGRLSTESVGRPDSLTKVSGGDEFAVVLGPGKTRLTARDFSIVSARASGGAGALNSLKVTLDNKERGLRAEVRYDLKLKDFYVRKSITFRNRGKQPLQILDAVVESLKFPSAQDHGVGKPVYAGDLFLGLEFPTGRNEASEGLVSLFHFPGKILQPGESLTTKKAVIGVARSGQSTAEAFDEYVKRIALRKPEVITQYGNWAVYDYLSDSVWPDEKMVLKTVDELAKLKKVGWLPDYYLMDAGWYDTKGDYTDYVKPAWPNGPKRMVDAIAGLGIDYGLWFDVGGGITDNPAMDPSRYSTGRLCLASEPYISTFKNAILTQSRELGLEMVKLDFATFDCDNEKHGHLLKEYAQEATLTSFLDMLDEVRKERPKTKYIIFNGFYRSPWWLMHVDTIYTNDPAPSESPAIHLRDSINRQTDMRLHEHRYKYMMPWYTIDDCGLMIGNMGTIYWLNDEEWRKTWVMNIGRGGLMPFIYGNLALFDDDDSRFLVKIWRILKDNVKVFRDTRAILGEPNGKEVYGYSHFDGAHGFVFMSNPTFERKEVSLKLDSSLGLKSWKKLSISEIFPVECRYDGGKSGFAPGTEVKMELAPFEVRALEIGAAAGSSAKLVPPRRSAETSVAVPIAVGKVASDKVTDSMIEAANKQLAHLASSTRIKVEPVVLTREKLAAADGLYTGTTELPDFSTPQTLAIPVRFVTDGNPRRYNNASTRTVVVAICEGKQVILEITPEYGRVIWSKTSWVTFHTKLAPELSGKKLDIMAIALSVPDAEMVLDTAYVMGQE